MNCQNGAGSPRHKPRAARARFNRPERRRKRLVAGAASATARCLEHGGTARTVTRPARLRLTSIVHHLERVGWRARTDHCSQHLSDWRHYRAAGHLSLPQVRRRNLCHRHDRHPGAARGRSADRLRDGRRPVRQRLHGRTRLDEDARRSRCAAHHGFDPVEVLVLPRIVALVLAAPMSDVSRLDGGALRGKPGVLALGGITPDIFLPGFGRRFRCRLLLSA